MLTRKDSTPGLQRGFQAPLPDRRVQELTKMANQWFRVWHDMPNDPKWRTIARHSKQPISLVISTYLHVLSCASNATERGRTQGLSTEDVASALDVDIDQIEAVLTAMQGRVLDGDKVSGWEKRQPVREDDSAARSKAWRELKKAEQEAERSRTQPNAEKRPDTDTYKEEPPTPLSTVVDAGPKADAKPKRQASQFDRFWSAWPKSPRKVGKAACEAKWKRVGLDHQSDAIVAHVEAMAASQQWREGFEPSPQTYLNQRRWEDGVPADRPAPQPGQAAHGADWWESAAGIEEEGERRQVARKSGEDFFRFKVRVFKAAGQGKWRDMMLADLLRTKSQAYASVFEYFNGTPPMEGI